MTAPLLYSSLASLWLEISPPDEYQEEVASFRLRFQKHGIPDGAEILHLGSGGGSIDFLLKKHYRITGVDSSPQMIAEARKLNPDVAYVEGDMRSVRLSRTFDAVLAHDAISYMTSVADLEAVYRTAAVHLEAGGLMVALPEELRERLAARETSAEIHSSGSRSVTMIESAFDPDPADHSFEVVYVFLIRENGTLRVEVDRHINGVFELDEFLGAMKSAGFLPKAEPWELTEWGDDPEMPLITAVRT